MRIDFEKIDADYVREHLEAFYSDIINQVNVDSVLKELEVIQINTPEGTSR